MTTAIAKLRKATVSFAMSTRLSLCPSVSTEKFDSHWKKFRETFIRLLFDKVWRFADRASQYIYLSN